MKATQEMPVRSLGEEDPQEKEVATPSSILAWRIPWTEQLGGYDLWGLGESGRDRAAGHATEKQHLEITIWLLRLLLFTDRMLFPVLSSGSRVNRVKYTVCLMLWTDASSPDEGCFNFSKFTLLSLCSYTKIHFQRQVEGDKLISKALTKHQTSIEWSLCALAPSSLHNQPRSQAQRSWGSCLVTQLVHSKARVRPRAWLQGELSALPSLTTSLCLRQGTGGRRERSDHRAEKLSGRSDHLHSGLGTLGTFLWCSGFRDSTCAMPVTGEIHHTWDTVDHIPKGEQTHPSLKQHLDILGIWLACLVLPHPSCVWVWKGVRMPSSQQSETQMRVPKRESRDLQGLVQPIYVGPSPGPPQWNAGTLSAGVSWRHQCHSPLVTNVETDWGETSQSSCSY